LQLSDFQLKIFKWVIRERKLLVESGSVLVNSIPLRSISKQFFCLIIKIYFEK